MSNILYYNRPIEIALARIESVLDQMYKSDQYKDTESRMLWHELDSARKMLLKELNTRQKENEIGISVI